MSFKLPTQILLLLVTCSLNLLFFVLNRLCSHFFLTIPGPQHVSWNCLKTCAQVKIYPLAVLTCSSTTRDVKLGFLSYNTPDPHSFLKMNTTFFLTVFSWPFVGWFSVIVIKSSPEVGSYLLPSQILSVATVLVGSKYIPTSYGSPVSFWISHWKQSRLS